jgi:glutamine synthetase
MSDMERWLRERRVTEVECLVADLNGIARGKILPTDKFLRSCLEETLRLPEVVFVQTVTGEYAPEDRVTDPAVRDVRMRPDPRSLRIVPWYEEPTAQVISDCYHHDGSEVAIAPRQVLRRILGAYAERGWRPVVAPELEFFLTKINDDPDYPLEPPIRRTRRPESARQSYGNDADNDIDPIIEDDKDMCEGQDIDIETLTH